MRLPKIVVVAAVAAMVGGCGTPSFLITPVSHTQKLREMQVGPGSGRDKIAVIEVEGVLVNARTGGFLQPTENKLSLFKEQLDRAAGDDRVKAVVLRVNSPGGTVTASDTMYQLLSRFRLRTKKPIIASLQEVAASGAYYVACASDQIMAAPTSVVGSIGVIFNTFDASRGMDKIGVRAESIKSGPLKDMGSPFKALSNDERAVMQGMVDEYYARFVAVVKAHRMMADTETLGTATDGRVFSGQQALAMGLVDRVGLLEDAIKLAREAGKAPGAMPVMYRRPYGYSGSIYASAPTEPPRANVTQLHIPGADALLPTGFYYLWQP
ncbi:MAG TPA: signal peptide peptidase SppA [Tepidisphaeraceae bacterium]|nr:signal peptide peptidase SppA [Tepidisphaeraceae bacterium]